MRASRGEWAPSARIVSLPVRSSRVPSPVRTSAPRMRVPSRSSRSARTSGLHPDPLPLQGGGKRLRETEARSVGVAVEEDRGPHRGGERGFPLAGGIAPEEVHGEAVPPQFVGLLAGARHPCLGHERPVSPAPLEVEVGVAAPADLLEELETQRGHRADGPEALAGAGEGAGPGEPEEPTRERRVEAETDVERAVLPEHPAQRLRQHARTGKRLGMGGAEQPGGAPRAAVAGLAPVDDGDLPARAPQEVGAGKADDARAEDERGAVSAHGAGAPPTRTVERAARVAAWAALA